jgi:hypothetical protein
MEGKITTPGQKIIMLVGMQGRCPAVSIAASCQAWCMQLALKKENDQFKIKAHRSRSFCTVVLPAAWLEACTRWRKMQSQLFRIVVYQKIRIVHLIFAECNVAVHQILFKNLRHCKWPGNVYNVIMINRLQIGGCSFSQPQHKQMAR